MINYTEVEVGDIVRVVGVGAPGYAALGDLLRITEVHVNSVKVEDRDGKSCEFVFNCGAARLEPTEWRRDFPALDNPARQGTGIYCPECRLEVLAEDLDKDVCPGCGIS